jgi:hypothetical protein
MPDCAQVFDGKRFLVGDSVDLHLRILLLQAAAEHPHACGSEPENQGPAHMAEWSGELPCKKLAIGLGWHYGRQLQNQQQSALDSECMSMSKPSTTLNMQLLQEVLPLCALGKRRSLLLCSS